MRPNLTLQKKTAQATRQQHRLATDPRVYLSLEHIVRLQHQATGYSFLPRQPVSSLLSGRYASRLRGRGLTFQELRLYQQGDDIRTMDWKATARGPAGPMCACTPRSATGPYCLIVNTMANARRRWLARRHPLEQGTHLPLLNP